MSYPKTRITHDDKKMTLTLEGSFLLSIRLHSTVRSCWKSILCRKKKT